MNNRISIYCLALLSIGLLAACKKTPDNFTAPEKGLEYYPLEIGKYVVYQMDSTLYDPNGDSTVYHSTAYIKEEVVDTLTDNNGNTLYRIEQYERDATNQPWVLNKVLSASIQGDQAIRTEDNLRFIKLVFPVKKGSNWDGNIHFPETTKVSVAVGEMIEMFKSWGYRTRLVGEPAAVGGFQFEETATVEEADNENLIELRQANAIYAKGIGLVYRELRILDTQCIDDCTGQPWEEKAEKGFILKQTILEHN